MAEFQSFNYYLITAKYLQVQIFPSPTYRLDAIHKVLTMYCSTFTSKRTVASDHISRENREWNTWKYKGSVVLEDHPLTV